MASRRVEGEAGSLVVSPHGGKVWLRTDPLGPVNLSHWMTPEQARELGFALLGAAETANDHRALQQQVRRPDLATQVAMGELT